jgi:hypothetical protein
MTQKGTVFVGILLIIFGAYLLLSEYGFGFRINLSWPIILIVLGLALLVGYYTSKPKIDYLRGGFILIALGIYFYVIHEIIGTGHGYSNYWPGIIIAVGIGLMAAGALNRDDRRTLTSGMIVTGVGAVLQYFTLADWRWHGPGGISVLIGVGLILLGIKFVIDFAFRRKAES